MEALWGNAVGVTAAAGVRAVGVVVGRLVAVFAPVLAELPQCSQAARDLAQNDDVIQSDE